MTISARPFQSAFSSSFGGVLARREFAEKLTVRFSLEGAVDEANGNEILGKNGRKRGFFGSGIRVAKILSCSGSTNYEMRNGFAFQVTRF